MGIKQNLNLYWLAGTALAVWMLFVHAPPYLASIEVRPLLWLHLIGVYPIYLACIHNTLITPSTFPWARNNHVWIGRIGLIFGVLGFVTGVLLEFRHTFDSNEIGGTIGITVGGSIQMITQFFGWRAIKKYKRIKKELEEINPVTASEEKIEDLKKQRDKALISHVFNMISVFLLGCGIPAIMRLRVGKAGWVFYVLITVTVLTFISYGTMFENRIKANSDRQKKEDLDEEVDENTNIENCGKHIDGPRSEGEGQ